LPEKKKITKDMSIGEVIDKFPETFEVFQKYNISCMGCPFAMMETLEQGAKAHGIDVKKIIKDLNDAIGEK